MQIHYGQSPMKEKTNHAILETRDKRRKENLSSLLGRATTTVEKKTSLV